MQGISGSRKTTRPPDEDDDVVQPIKKTPPNVDFYEGVRITNSSPCLGIEHVDLKSEKHAKCKYTFLDGSVYEGEFVKDKMHGRGKCTYFDGSVYEGQFLKGQRHGKGKLTYLDGCVYEIDFFKNKPHGKGKWSLNVEGKSYVLSCIFKKGCIVDIEKPEKESYFYVFMLLLIARTRVRESDKKYLNMITVAKNMGQSYPGFVSFFMKKILSDDVVLSAVCKDLNDTLKLKIF